MRCFKHYASALLLAGGLALVAWAGTARAAKADQLRLAGYTNPSSPSNPESSNPGSALNPGTTNPGSASENPSGHEPSAGSSGSSMMGGSSETGRLPQGVTPKQVSDTSDFRSTLDKFTNAVLKKDNFKDAIDYFGKSDRDRLSSSAGQNNDQLNQAIDDFNQAWKSKYNSSFSTDKDKAYADQYFSVSQGEVTNPEQVSHWPVKSTSSGSEQMSTANPNIQKGTQIAVVTLQGAGGSAGSVTASLLREGSNWRFDIPDNVTTDDLRASLTRHIREVTTMKNQWPSDPNDAARVVTYHLIQALYTAAPGSSPGSSGNR